MTNIIIVTEIFSILILVILWYGNRFEAKLDKERKKNYELLVLALLAAGICDLISWILDGKPEFTTAIYITTTLSMLFSFFTFVAFMRYVHAYIGERQKVSKKHTVPAMIYIVCVAIWTLLHCYNGYLFTIVDGVYNDGPGYLVYLVLNAIVLFYVLMEIVHFRKALGLHDTIAMLSYLFLPCVAIIVNFVIPEYSFAFPAMSLSLLIIYIMVQSEQQSTLLQQGMEASLVARQDPLTGLQNRLAFNEAAAKIEPDQFVGMVFCDINGLKYTNDIKGHEAGDALLCGFTDMLVTNYRKSDLYRVSGDEFIVMITGLDEEEFYRRAKQLRYRIQLLDVPIASMGVAYGVGNVDQLGKEAEDRMYEDKKEYYKRFPEFSRR